MTTQHRNLAFWLGFGLLALALFQLLTGGAWVAFLILGFLMLALGKLNVGSKGER